MQALRSIRVRLTLWYVLLLAIILAAFSAGIYLMLRHNLSSSLNDSLRNRTNILLDVVRYEGSRPTLAGFVSPVDPNVGEHFVRVYDAHGDVTFDDTADAGDIPIDAAAIEDALAGRSSRHSTATDDETMRVQVTPIGRGGEVGGVLEVGLSEGDLSDTLRALLLILAVAYPATLVVASLSGMFLASRALAPIDSITGTARRISAEDLSRRLDVTEPQDEVGRLARTLNDMIARLEAAFRRQRQFTADASHELRTPLTAIKGQVEVALSRPRGVETYREVLEDANQEIDRLIRLVGSLLTLARADAGEIPIASDSVDLGELISVTTGQVRPSAAQRGVELAADPGPVVALQADQDLLLQLLLNLLDNALKNTSRGGRVTAGWDAEDGVARLWVRDTGIGIAAEHLDCIFDRFYRVDKARSRAEGGVGLGLSISRWIAEAHGGSLSVQSVPGQGSTFTVSLPHLTPDAAS